MSYRRKELRKGKSFENTDIDSEAWLLNNPHKVETFKKEEEEIAVSFSSVYLLSSLSPSSVFILEFW